MKFPVTLFFLLIGCAVINPVIASNPILQNIYNQDTARIPRSSELSVMDFGAKCDGVTDDFIADSTAFAFAIAHPYMCSTITFPIGTSIISKPLLLQNKGQFFTIHIKGMLPAKEASGPYLSQIYYTGRSGFAIGIQLGRGIIIENLAITGQYTLPNKFTDLQIVTSRFSDWIDPTISDSRYAPYAGIVIDPYPNASGSSGGTSGVEIRQCSIKQFMVGIALSPNAYTLNDEMINIIDDDIEVVRVAISIGQDQSKEIHIDRLKIWGACHTVLDGLTYGRGTGGGSVSIEGGNIAGTVNELFNLVTDRFPLSVKDLYAESLFRIGTVGNGTGSNFINCQMDFVTIQGWPEPDFMVVGAINFYGGDYRYYDNQTSHRLNFVNTGSMFRDLTLNVPPIIQGLVGWPAQLYPTAMFDHVHLYNYGKLLAQPFDTLIRITQPTYLYMDSVKWVSTAYGSRLGSIAKVGDYLLGAPSGGWGHYHDQMLNKQGCPTIQIGRVNKISNDTLYMGNVGRNAPENRGFDNIFLSRLR